LTFAARVHANLPLADRSPVNSGERFEKQASGFQENRGAEIEKDGVALWVGEHVAAVSEVEVDDAPLMHGLDGGAKFRDERRGQLAGEVSGHADARSVLDDQREGVD
jgi:hypothetical protein